MVVEIDKTKCTGCGTCITVCPNEAIDWVEYGPYEVRAEVIKDYCTECGKCIEACKYFAIKKG
jgi:heterodisulfide reductase subunit A